MGESPPRFFCGFFAVFTRTPIPVMKRWANRVFREVDMKKCIWAASAVLLGCGAGEGAPTATVMQPSTVVVAGGEAPVMEAAAVEAQAAQMPVMEADYAHLPDAPWAAAMVSTDTLPENVQTTLASAENYDSCAPLVPAGMDAVPARASTLDGGWAMEFDARGQAGVRESGATCRRCGRSSFGVAGTSMTADDLSDVETGESPEATFGDGSVLMVEAEEGVASATLTVGGQGCVYQVWSFQGEEHLQSLLEGMRLVSTEAPSDNAVAVH